VGWMINREREICNAQSKICMSTLKNSIAVIAATAILLFLFKGIIPYGQQQHLLRFTAEAGGGGAACVDYDQRENS
jgi:hypothetical protein